MVALQPPRIPPFPREGWQGPREQPYKTRYWERCSLCQNLIHRREFHDWDFWFPFSARDVMNSKPCRIWHDGRGTMLGIRCQDCATDTQPGAWTDYRRTRRWPERWPPAAVPDDWHDWQ